MFDHTQAPRPNFAFVESNSTCERNHPSRYSTYTHESRSIPSVFDHILITCILPGISLSFHFVLRKNFSPVITFPFTFFALSDHPEVKHQPNSHHVVSFQNFPAVSQSYRRHSCQSCDHDVNAQKAPFLLINMIAKRLDK